MDGFVSPLRRRQPINPLGQPGQKPQKPAPITPGKPAQPIALPSIDIPDEKPPKKRRFRFSKPSRKTVKRIVIAVIVLILVVAGYFAWRFLVVGNQIFKGDVIGALLSEGKQLKMDENGRTNIVIFGTSEDDPGHDAGELADSIMVMSVDQKKKDPYLISIPRDLWVKYGKACEEGYEGIINVVYQCGKRIGGNEEAGQEAMRAKAAEVLGLDIQYSVHINYTVMRELVGAVGGITVTIESRDPRGQMDSNFDWKCGLGDPKVSRAERLRRCPPNGHFIDYPNGPVNLDAEHALYLAQARGDAAPTYGFELSNFDREKNQRKILVALKEKATSVGILANPVAVNNLLNALGGNVRTNFDAGEVKTLMKIANESKPESFKSIPLNDEAKPLVTTGNVGTKSIVRPVKGLYDYSDIQKTVVSTVTADAASLEGAVVDVLNATAPTGSAQAKADELTAKGITIGKVNGAPDALGTAPIVLYDVTPGKKPESLKKLEKLLGVKAKSGAPAGVTTTANFVIVLGASTSSTN